ncbi:hypothetical protein [Halobacillus faecis]|uniref:Uncharacterized protein n=1 Tax=Halobacillus faecis TaxID=360184 RepID=A0A511WWJ2_9BACI|nr:hypothetical protein [Halobacillus faecis]GEN55506.1 hypothetical protein HFA01_37680 [Halobacillus faecis]
MLEFYTRKDVAENLDVTLNDVDKWIREGKLIESKQGIATEQLRTREQIIRLHPRFFIEREAELDQIPKKDDEDDSSQ